ncbi:MAG: HIT domain-containing protein [Candidatus Woesearchaeota archaeon]
MGGNCIFCDIVAKEVKADILAENEWFVAFPDAHPISEGHTLIVPKRHAESFFDIEEDDLRFLGPFVKEVATLLKNKFHADGVNVVNANGKAAQQSVFHFHVHVVPRFEDDGLDLWFHGQ